LFGITLSISLSIGLYNAIKNRHNQSTKEVLLAGGNMGIVPVALSLFASFFAMKGEEFTFIIIHLIMHGHGVSVFILTYCYHGL
jgi:Na+/proline symporter